MADSVRQWTLVLVLTAFLLSVLVLGQTITRYASAYLSAPTEVSAFLDALDSSVEENESYDRDLSRVPRLEDKLRLSRLLRDIQKAGDDLREDLNRLLADCPDNTRDIKHGLGSIDISAGSGHSLSTPRLRVPARFLWAARRAELSERVRRLDLLRMRFLVVYMSIVAATTTAAAEKVERSAAPTLHRDAERPGGGGALVPVPPPLPSHLNPPHFPALGLSIAEIKRKPPLRRVTTHAIGVHDTITEEEKPGGGAHHRGWAGVIQELQRSPLMHKRHASIENAMARSMTP